MNHFLIILYPMSERELLNKAKAGDYDAFCQLVGNNKNKLYALALKMTANEQDAQDIVQDTLLKAIDKIDQFRGDASFGTWLYSIALNQSRAHLSKQRETELKDVEAYLPGNGANFEGENHDIAGRLFDWEDPHKHLENAELRQIINEAISELPDKYREAFLLRYFEELSIKEIAKIIKETDASTKSRVLRAKLAVRDKLAKTFEDRYGQKMS